MWERRSRCSSKYKHEKPSIFRSTSMISFNICHLTKSTFTNLFIPNNWRSLLTILDTNLQYFINFTTCPHSCLSKSSCVGNSCGGGGVIRDSLGRFIMSFILPLGQGTSNLVEDSSFLFGLKWCVDNGHTFILGETDSLLLQNCINDSRKVPMRIHEEVQEIKKLVIDHGVITRHCFREANKVPYTELIKVYIHSIETYQQPSEVC
ncbi:hypothetical protein R3W88_022744 [Solanum pinnatisectum]|uniref:RNase H type-1 domain-containing protein n=1 Tax=Solanum pinnatisectum TaxID=50273 RepID=A0AAV9LVN3_9SOLN|nr:hypothetical protein R3W88_022744 [Solanum pinnatisectum]